MLAAGGGSKEVQQGPELLRGEAVVPQPLLALVNLRGEMPHHVGEDGIIRLAALVLLGKQESPHPADVDDKIMLALRAPEMGVHPCHDAVHVLPGALRKILLAEMSGEEEVLQLADAMDVAQVPRLEDGNEPLEVPHVGRVADAILVLPCALPLLFWQRAVRERREKSVVSLLVPVDVVFCHCRVVLRPAF